MSDEPPVAPKIVHQFETLAGIDFKGPMQAVSSLTMLCCISSRNYNVNKYSSSCERGTAADGSDLPSWQESGIKVATGI